MRLRNLLCGAGAAAAALGAGVPAAASAAQTLDTVPGITQVAAWNGTIAWSTYDAAGKDWRLVFSKDGGAPVAAPIAPSPVPFDVDLGTNRNGSTYAVYSRCATPPVSPAQAHGKGCDIYRLSVASGRETQLTSLSSPVYDDYDPTIFRGEIAFLRDERVGGRAGTTLRVANTTSGSHGTRVLAKTNSETLRSPQLTYDRVAYIVGYAKGRYGFGQQEVHTRTLSGRTARNVYRATSGGANFANITNIALASDDLHAFVWGRTNEGSGAGNRIVRYDAGAGRLSYAAGSPRYRNVADAGGDAGIVAVEETDGGGATTESAVRQLGPLDFSLRP
jgi:hypothetical protein